jgi:hypothetical protein
MSRPHRFRKRRMRLLRRRLHRRLRRSGRRHLRLHGLPRSLRRCFALRFRHWGFRRSWALGCRTHHLSTCSRLAQAASDPQRSIRQGRPLGEGRAGASHARSALPYDVSSIEAFRALKHVPHRGPSPRPQEPHRARVSWCHMRRARPEWGWRGQASSSRKRPQRIGRIENHVGGREHRSRASANRRPVDSATAAISPSMLSLGPGVPGPRHRRDPEGGRLHACS